MALVWLHQTLSFTIKKKKNVQPVAEMAQNPVALSRVSYFQDTLIESLSNLLRQNEVLDNQPLFESHRGGTTTSAELLAREHWAC
jgi:hypothetical protein